MLYDDDVVAEEILDKNWVDLQRIEFQGNNILCWSHGDAYFIKCQTLEMPRCFILGRLIFRKLIESLSL